MKKAIVGCTLCIIILFSTATAQTEDEMKAWESYMTPGDIHKMMATWNGEWTEEITMWMDSATPPTKTTATARNEMIMGGRYQVSKSTGTMMGAPFEGMSLTGYDNAKKIFTSIWVDNFGTGTITMEGMWDEQGKTITYHGTGVDPVTGKDVKMREVLKILDNDTQSIEMYDTKNGKESKTMEIRSTRKK
jgi:hypothetical protein